MNEQHINAIIELFKQAKVWNNGEFVKSVRTYCDAHELLVDIINTKLQKAFEDYLATNIQSEAAIRFRLTQLIPKS